MSFARAGSIPAPGTMFETKPLIHSTIRGFYFCGCGERCGLGFCYRHPAPPEPKTSLFKTSFAPPPTKGLTLSQILKSFRISNIVIRISYILFFLFSFLAFLFSLLAFLFSLFDIFCLHLRRST